MLFYTIMRFYTFNDEFRDAVYNISVEKFYDRPIIATMCPCATIDDRFGNKRGLCVFKTFVFIGLSIVQ